MATRRGKSRGGAREPLVPPPPPGASDPSVSMSTTDRDDDDDTDQRWWSNGPKSARVWVVDALYRAGSMQEIVHRNRHCLGQCGKVCGFLALPMFFYIILTLTFFNTMEYDVLVLGGGLAGLGAARDLSAAGVSVAVIEARDRLGGRLASVSLESGALFDIGGSWIRNYTDNPLMPYFRRAKLACGDTYAKSRVWTASGSKIADPDFDAVATIWTQAYKDAMELARDAQRNNEFASLSHGLDLALNKAGVTLTEVQRHIFDWKTWMFADYEYALSGWDIRLVPEQLNDVDDEAPDCFVYHGAYANIIAEIAKDIPHLATRLHLNSPVSRIEYDDSGVDVYTRVGQRYHADRAIVTFPVAVLQRGGIEFSPALPSWKRDAIDSQRTATLTKIAMEFPSVFWDKDINMHGFLSDDPYDCKAFLNINRLDTSSKLLIGFYGGHQARVIESMPSERIKHRLMQQLRLMFPGVTIPNPVDFVVTRWSLDPYALGAYSSLSLNSTKDTFYDLGLPVGRVNFAGEATTGAYYGYSHGAFISGEREANRILHADEGVW